MGLTAAVLDNLLGKTLPCACGQPHHIPTRRTLVGAGAVSQVGELARAEGWRGRLVLVADPQTFAAGGAQTVASLEAAGFEVERLVLEPHPVAGPPLIDQVRVQMGSPHALVAVGSGTINDIAKSAADAAGLPYLSVGTALSMNGYTSAISALLEGGVKRTVPVRPPAIVVLDLDVCATAPREMTLAGLGDMLSKPFSEADWRLAARVDGGYHCERPGNVLTEAFERMLDAAGGIGRLEQDALAALAEAILLSGISMAMAGVSSPASGGEHLVSHYWDMMQYARGGHPFALHGTQVGVASCLIEPLHHRVQELAQRGVDIEACMARWPATLGALRDEVRARHPRLPEDVTESVVLEAEKKWRPPAEQRERLHGLVLGLGDTLEWVGAALLAEGAIRDALVASGAPVRPEDVHASLPSGYLSWGHVRDMRGRYTVWDLAAELGLLESVAHHRTRPT